jgi:hypothetical protein
MYRFLRTTILALLVGLPGAAAADGEQSAKARRVMTWVPPYAIGDSKARLGESFDGLGIKDGITHLGLQFWNPSKEGGIELVTRFKEVNDSRVSELRKWGHAHGVRVMLCVYNGTSSGWDWDLARSAFDIHREDFVDALVTETLRLKLDGVDIDLEGKGDLDASKDAFVRFIKELSARLRAEGKELSVDTFAYKWHAPRQSWWPDILPHVDGLNVMGYAETGASADDWRSYAALKKAAGSYSSRLLIGMPGNAAQWQATSVADHLGWVADDDSVGLAIWDARLEDPVWRTRNTWLEIKRIRGTAERGGAQNP